jgi:hypothetical protein
VALTLATTEVADVDADVDADADTDANADVDHGMNLCL